MIVIQIPRKPKFESECIGFQDCHQAQLWLGTRFQTTKWNEPRTYCMFYDFDPHGFPILVACWDEELKVLEVLP